MKTKEERRDEMLMQIQAAFLVSKHTNKPVEKIWEDLMNHVETYAQQANDGLREALEKIANIKFIDDQTVFIFIKIAREALSGKQETEL